MNKQMKAVLALTALGGALYGAAAANTTAQAEPQKSPLLAKRKAPALKLKPPTWNGLKAAPPPLTTLELKSIPTNAIPIEFNGNTVYWIPLDEKAPVKAQTRAHRAG